VAAAVVIAIAAIWLGSATEASFRSEPAVLEILTEQLRQRGFTVSREELEQFVVVQWAFSPFPPLHVARLEFQASCVYSVDYLYLAWGSKHKLLWDNGA
jgi:hypothetical protein